MVPGPNVRPKCCAQLPAGRGPPLPGISIRKELFPEALIWVSRKVQLGQLPGYRPLAGHCAGMNLSMLSNPSQTRTPRPAQRSASVLRSSADAAALRGSGAVFFGADCGDILYVATRINKNDLDNHDEKAEGTTNRSISPLKASSSVARVCSD